MEILHFTENSESTIGTFWNPLVEYISVQKVEKVIMKLRGEISCKEHLNYYCHQVVTPGSMYVGYVPTSQKIMHISMYHQYIAGWKLVI